MHCSAGVQQFNRIAAEWFRTFTGRNDPLTRMKDANKALYYQKMAELLSGNPANNNDQYAPVQQQYQNLMQQPPQPQMYDFGRK
jgi:hypothetical protein